ncbi:MAG: GNAT family N-acetyltransferase [Lacisediminihabitans sp.]
MRPYAATDFARVLDLYAAVGWTAYTKAPDVLQRALAGSSTVLIETEPEVHGTERVLGLARVVSDGATICYLQDVVVHPSVRRTGLGSRLVTAVLEPYAAVRQKVLLTDDEAGQKAFYEALGYSSIEGTTLRAFTRFD